MTMITIPRVDKLLYIHTYLGVRANSDAFDGFKMLNFDSNLRSIDLAGEKDLIAACTKNYIFNYRRHKSTILPHVRDFNSGILKGLCIDYFEEEVPHRLGNYHSLR